MSRVRMRRAVDTCMEVLFSTENGPFEGVYRLRAYEHAAVLERMELSFQGMK